MLVSVKTCNYLFLHSTAQVTSRSSLRPNDLSYKGHHWHERCFKCAKCCQSLVEKPFAAKDKVLLCTECYSDEYSSRCFHCQKTIMPGSRKMDFQGSSWHESCFICQHCRQPLGTKLLITKDKENYCLPCFEKQFAHHCYSCRKVITSGGVSYHDQPWHKECFVCAGCQTQLCGQRFISKDDSPYCVDCFSKLYAKKCAACKKPITALGGPRFISFEERQWHGECFRCRKCLASLVGQSFLTQQEDVLCHKCGSAP
ncbi:four and a half LIM domains protein 5 isoform X3 [Pogoniulus pusillus]|uniref:four and a half LIM domains protein 5 isoform X3 n=1 Tax=Pogoniulus pusillus TaxID=488313 RepID=UPI0030B942DD